MSLDVYLEGEPEEVDCYCSAGENVHKRIERKNYYEANISHNLREIAEVAGIYTALWRPEEVGITLASQLIVPLTAGLAGLRLNRGGSISYDYFIAWVDRYLDACRKHPLAHVKVSR